MVSFWDVILVDVPWKGYRRTWPRCGRVAEMNMLMCKEEKRTLFLKKKKKVLTRESTVTYPVLEPKDRSRCSPQTRRT